MVTLQKTTHLLQNRQKRLVIMTMCLSGMVIFNVFLDFLFTRFQKSAFYISESLLFSSYWLLFLPLLPLFLKLTAGENIKWKLAYIGIVTGIHLIAYPALVWALSRIGYNHTFAYWQTFQFGLSAYFIKSVIIYVFALTTFPGRKPSAQTAKKPANKTGEQHFRHAILVADPNHSTSALAVNDISYISANPPYVDIYHTSKKYLHRETLRSLENQLDKKRFVRIHKSHIVNLQKVISYQSRQNGDYDIILSDRTVLRVSRNYAKEFKSAFELYTQLTTK